MRRVFCSKMSATYVRSTGGTAGDDRGQPDRTSPVSLLPISCFFICETERLADDRVNDGHRRRSLVKTIPWGQTVFSCPLISLLYSLCPYSLLLAFPCF